MQRYNSPLPAEDKLGKPSWPAIQRLLALAKPHLAPLAAAGVLMLISTAISLSYPLLGRAAIDDFGSAKDLARLDQYVTWFVALIAIAAFIGFVHAMLVARVGNRIVMDLRLNLFEHLNGLPVSFFDRHRSGDLASTISNNVTQVQGILTDDIIKLVPNVLTLVGGVAIAFTIDWRLTLIVVTLLFATMMFFVIFGRRLRKLNREALDGLADAMGSITEALANVRLVKAFTTRKHEQEKAREKLGRVLGLNMKSAASEALMGSVAGAGFALVLLGIIWYGGRRVMEGTLSVGDLFAFFLTVTIISGPMGSLASLYTRLQRAIGAGDRLFAILDEVPEPADPPDAVEFPHGNGEVVFRGVSFAYVEAQPVLQGLTLSLPAGGVTAIVGPSGAGKTTLSSLLYRFYDAQAGEILVDGVPVDKIRRHDLRANIGIVPQETILFNGTLRENIRYGRLHATDAEVEQAARDANVEEFALPMGEGYETLIGERGITLSGGQRQRVAIARALLKNPKILILDEATSALDSKSEALVKEALERLMAGRTTLVIAHRLSTVQNANQIAVLADGKIVEIGTHDELVKQEGRYAELYDIARN